MRLVALAALTVALVAGCGADGGDEAGLAPPPAEVSAQGRLLARPHDSVDDPGKPGYQTTAGAPPSVRPNAAPKPSSLPSTAPAATPPSRWRSCVRTRTQ